MLSMVLTCFFCFSHTYLYLISYQVVPIKISELRATFLFSFSQFLLQCLIHITVSGKLMQT